MTCMSIRLQSCPHEASMTVTPFPLFNTQVIKSFKLINLLSQNKTDILLFVTYAYGTKTKHEISETWPTWKKNKTIIDVNMNSKMTFTCGKRKILLPESEISTLNGMLFSWSHMQELATTSARFFKVFPPSKTRPLTG